jgi:hypothetical protein
MILEKGYGQEYLFDFHEGKIKRGLGIGTDLDTNLVFKKGQFVMINGLDNVGKTAWIMWYYLVLSLKYDLKFCIWSGENRPAQQKRDLIQMLTGMKFKSIFKGDIIKLLNRIDNNFMFINNALLYNHKDLLKIFKNSKADACLIDPFTGLNHDRRVNQFERNYQLCNDIREHCNKTGQTIYVNSHPQTEAARRVYPLDNELAGHIQAPKKSDTEGGQVFANRCDDFVTIHRLVSHPELWTKTQIHIRKIKDTETGGTPTYYDQPILFDYNRGLGFVSDKDALEGLRIACKNDLDELMKGQKVPENFYDTEKQEEWK